MMNLKNTLKALSVTAFAFFVGSCRNLDIPAMNDGEVYQIWSTIHATYAEPASDGAVEKDCVMFNDELVDSLPAPMQTIVAYYYSRQPEYIRGDGDAAVELLEGWRYDETLPEPNADNAIFIANLYAMKSEGRILFWHCDSWDDHAICDEFRIARRGRIRHPAHHERVRIDRETNKPIWD